VKIITETHVCDVCKKLLAEEEYSLDYRLRKILHIRDYGDMCEDCYRALTAFITEREAKESKIKDTL
jgi:hypothetical protein